MPELPTGSVTFLFTDVEGSTRLWEQDPERMKQALARHDALIRSTISQSSGYVFSTGGDSFAAAFQSARQAVSAALRAQQGFESRRADEAIGLRVRIALHAGEAEEREGDYYGPTLNRCARLLSAGHGGQILLSASVAALVAEQLPGDARLTDLGEIQLRDLSRPEHVFQLTHPDLPTQFPPLKASDSVHHNLPVMPTVFIGREHEIDEVRKALVQTRLVTLVGPGGAGKTRLAIQTAADRIDFHPDGVWFVDLAPIGEPRFVIKAFAQALGLVEQGGTDLAETLIDYLRRRRILLVVDNCEHLIEQVAVVINDLLNKTDKVHVLTTSRESLRVPGETAIHIAAMGIPPEGSATEKDIAGFDSVRLFGERARVAVPDFRITDANAGAVAEICRRLDGLPLALELAAARLVLFTPQQIAARLDERFALLTRGDRTALPRHQTLLAAIEWSHDLLDEDERSLLRRLGVFVGDFDIESLEYVCADDGNEARLTDVLSRLVDKSLIEVRSVEQGRFYRMLDTIRRFALTRLEVSGEVGQIRSRHADRYRSLCSKGRDGLLGPEAGDWFERLELAGDNAQAALDWLLAGRQDDAALEIARALGAFWLLERRVVEGLWWLRKVAAVTSETVSRDRVETLGWAASIATIAAEQAESIGFSEDALDLAMAMDDPLALAIAQTHRGLAEIDDLKKAAALLQSATDGLAQAGSAWTPWVRYWLGYHLYGMGDTEEAERTLSRSLDEARELGQLITQSDCLVTLGDLAQARGDSRTALRLHEESLEIAKTLGSGWALAGAWSALGDDYMEGGRIDEAIDYLQRAIDIQPGNLLTLCGLYAALAEARFREGDGEQWRQDLGQSLHYAKHCAGKRQWLALLRPLYSAAWLAEGVDKQELSARLLGARERLGREVGEQTRARSVQMLAEDLRESLGSRHYEEVVGRGANVGFEEIIDEALAALVRL